MTIYTQFDLSQKLRSLIYHCSVYTTQNAETRKQHVIRHSGENSERDVTTNWSRELRRRTVGSQRQVVPISIDYWPGRLSLSGLDGQTLDPSPEDDTKNK